MGSFYFRKILTCYNERDSKGILTNDILEVTVMKFNFEMEASEMKEIISGFTAIMNAYVDNEKSARNEKIKVEEKKAEITGTELRKAREALERAIK